MQLSAQRFLIAGGAGFIGSHFVDALLRAETTRQVTVYDNFSSGRFWHLEHHARDSRLKVVKGDIHDRNKLIEAMHGHETVIHLASNPDIARAVTEPDIDFREGTELTNHVAEAVRLTKVNRVLYASGSGVYGELGELEAREDHGPLIPISTYGASKLAGEAVLAAYAAMFDLKACAFRFGNVVGRRQTHGVGFDFLRRLRKDPSQLHILGDGSQSKSYVHVEDVVKAVLLAHEKTSRPFDAFNVATGDYISVTEIADLAGECLDLQPGSVHYHYSGGDRGWKGDVPVIRLNLDKIRGLGWKPARKTRQALQAAMVTMLADLNANRGADVDFATNGIRLAPADCSV